MTNVARVLSMPVVAFVLVLVLTLPIGVAGCGKDPPDLTPFLGTWSVSTAALTISCTDHGVQAIAITAPTMLVAGVSSDLLDTDATCPVTYDVSGLVAHAVAGQTCDDPAVISRMHLLEDTFTVDRTGIAAMHVASGTLDGFINISLGETVECTFSEMGVYRRAGN